jgi:hypothetical protein
MWLIPIIFILLLISGTAFAYLMGAVSVLTFDAGDKTPFLSILPHPIFAQLDAANQKETVERLEYLKKQSCRILRVGCKFVCSCLGYEAAGRVSRLQGGRARSRL